MQLPLAAELDSGNNVGSFTSLAIDGSGNLHVAYADSTAGTLRYLETDPGFGNVDKVLVDQPKSGRWNALAVDSKNGVHISTYDFGDADVHLATKAAGASAFTVTPVETSGSVGRFTGIAVDDAGGAHVVYTDDTHKTLRHAYVCP